MRVSGVLKSDLCDTDYQIMPPPKIAKNLARVMGVLLVLLALIGCLPNPLIGSEGYFRTDLILNGVLAGIGALLLLFTTKGEATAATGLYFGAMVAFVLAAVGYIQIPDGPPGMVVKLFDMVACNLESVYLMGGMAVVLMICGMMNTSSRQVIRD